MKNRYYKFTITLFLIPFLTASCFSRQTPKTGISLKPASDTAMGVRLQVPDDWKIHSGKFFQIIAVGLAANDYPAWIEYRGLETTPLPDQNSKDLYAQGWFEAITKNYPEWKSDAPVKIQVGEETVYEILGTYRVAGDTYRKLGRLRIHSSRIHAIYYTTYDIGSDPVITAFREMDAEHNFNYKN